MNAADRLSGIVLLGLVGRGSAALSLPVEPAPAEAAVPVVFSQEMFARSSKALVSDQ